MEQPKCLGDCAGIPVTMEEDEIMSNGSRIKQPKITEVKIDRTHLEKIACGKCGGTVFEQVYQVLKIPSVVSPTGHEILKEDGLLRCAGCGRCAKLQEIEKPETEEKRH